jgi:heme A synthase
MSQANSYAALPHADRPRPGFVRYAWGVLGFNLLVILWGAFVRATGSGAGCGNHWPLCNGEVVPRAPRIETLIELGHRLTSGIDGFLVLGLLVAAWRLFPRQHPVRWAALGSFLFLVSEALVGAGLVRFELVAENDSMARAVVMCVHLVNTFLLLAFLTLAAVWAGPTRGPRWRGQGSSPVLLSIGLGALLLLGISGAVTALGDTLFPQRAFSLEDLSPASHFLLRLRILHPAIAAGVGIYIVVLGSLFYVTRRGHRLRRAAGLLVGTYFLQLALGLLNVALAAPVWLQLLHLLLADITWIALIALSAEELADDEAQESASPAVVLTSS